jgi:CRISPR-associated protein Cmr2
MADYLFLFTIGPVQDFIAAARRTRDLWAGSQLLSELSRTAALALRGAETDSLIFPAPDKENTKLQDHDVVNRILATIETDNPIAFGNTIETTVRERLVELCTATFDSTKLNGKKFITWPQEGSRNYRTKAEKQVADLIEIYWAAVERTNDYNHDRARVEAVLAARKNTRNFTQPTEWADYVPKSSIDGLRESVIDESEYPRGLTDPEREQKIKQLFRNYGAKGAERLSGVDLFKRHYKQHHGHDDFPSTSHFAALPMLKRFETPYIAEATTRWKDYLSVLEQQGVELQTLDRQRIQHPIIEDYDASLLFAERLSDVIEEAQKREAAQRALYTFLSAFTNGKEPEPYYALLHGDGDFMGRAIDTLATQPDGENKHRAFSRQLDTFASGVRAIVEGKHLGALVYSGGDDVLALLPLHTVVQCAKDLADSFAAQMSDLSLIDKPSLSVGVAICHHLEPLSDALELARGAEKIAKKVDGKNALAIILSKRGSGDRTISGSWSGTFYQRLLDLTGWHRSGAIPDSAAYDLHSLIERLSNTLPPVALKAEAVRILKRKRGLRGQAEQANAELVALAETLPTTKEAAKEWGVSRFANELIVTREFAKAQGFIEADKQQGAAV